ncbi:hypothetical protein [Bacillus sp. CECT 9360]|uniref:hypothetical protein n=1 Tax=Bacillus sp. CECT 9360 TaxID=2845821 RepID=UPI001E54BD94|nr:hypothetical protein [Bacillus sp. CECT 9360]CAH0345466.1 hypothetical protein BCI9360_01752 [Bacillus sp. CECT 9360]
MSIYQNIFHYYRGQTRNKDEGTNILQIENNVTKALLNVLQHSSNNLTLEFMKYLGFPFLESRDFNYRYQLNGKLDKVTPYAAVIGISENREVRIGSVKNYNIPDAAILSNEVSLLIENKIGFNSYLVDAQLEGHNRNFADEQIFLEDPIIISWEEVRQFLKKQQQHFKERNDQITLFLLTQFEEFCIINGLGDRQRSKEYFFLRFEIDSARKLAKQVDSYIMTNPLFDIEDAGTSDGIGYRRKGFTKFATLTTARQRCLILHIGRKEQKTGLEIQKQIDDLLGKRFDRKKYEEEKYPHEAYIRLEWVENLGQISPYIDYAYEHRK